MSESPAKYNGESYVELRVEGWPESLHQPLRLLAAERHTSIKSLLLEAVEQYVARNTRNPPRKR